MIPWRTLVARAASALGLLGAGVGLSNCSDAGGPSFITLGASVRNATVAAGASGGSGEGLADLCVRLPVLLGSRVEKEKSFPGGFRVAVDATRDRATLTLDGVAEATTRSYSFAELELGVSESIPLVVDGVPYALAVASGCTNP